MAAMTLTAKQIETLARAAEVKVALRFKIEQLHTVTNPKAFCAIRVTPVSNSGELDAFDISIHGVARLPRGVRR